MRLRFDKWVPAALMGVCIALAGWFIGNSLMEFSRRDRVVSVRGLCEREVMADDLLWPIVFYSMGNDVKSLYGECKRNEKVIADFLISKGVRAEEIRYSAARIEDQYNAYSSQMPKFRYRIQGTLTVSSQRIAELLPIVNGVDELMSLGIDLSQNSYSSNQKGMQFSFRGLNGVKPSMIEEATKNARQAAEQFAADSKSGLGKIKSATQGQFSITAEDQNNPHIMTVRVVTSVNYFLRD